MSMKPRDALTTSCRCGGVVLQVVGPPILRGVCYCASCQEGGRRIEQLPDAPPVLDADGGTDFVLYRKDRVRCTHGGERLKPYRLKPDSPTRRMVATCCNSAMFLDFTKGHWLTVYRARVPEPVPPLEMRIMTAGAREGVVIPADVLSYPGYSGKFMGKLLKAWIAIGFRRPMVEGVPA